MAKIIKKNRGSDLTMTKEQEAIEYLKESVLIYKNTIPKISESIETVLSMLKEKDKQIDLMVKYIDNNNYIDNEECQFQWDFKIEKCIGNGDCKDCIKQYFERKSKE